MSTPTSDTIPMSGSDNQSIEARRKYVTAFNATMVKIWREQIALLGVIDTGALYRSTIGISMTADGKFVDITLAQAFNTYGIFVDYGTGRNTPRGNSGDISCQREQSGARSNSAERSRNRCEANFGKANGRQRKRWFSRKYFASVMNIQEFYADSLGQEFCRAVSNALNPDLMRKQVQS